MKPWVDRIPIILPVLWALVLATSPYRPWISVAIIALAAGTLASLLSKTHRQSISWNIPLGVWVIWGLFALYLVGFLRFWDINGASIKLEQKLSLLAMPLLWILSGLTWQKVRLPTYLLTLAGLSIAGVIMIAGSVLDWTETHNLAVFYYDQFTLPLSISPIYFAFVLSILLLWPIDEDDVPISRPIHRVFRFFIWGLLFLSASKLFTFTTLILVGLKWMRSRKFQWKWWYAMIGVGLIALLTPTALRTYDVVKSDLSIVRQDEYRYDTEFNGLTLRLVQFRFGLEILREQDAWLFGLGPINTKPALDAKYEEYNMYTGNQELGDVGYRKYNFHNQWMETTAAVGLFGTLLLITLFFLLMMRTNLLEGASSLVLILLLFTFTESYLERQLGLVVFSMMISMLFKPSRID